MSLYKCRGSISKSIDNIDCAIFKLNLSDLNHLVLVDGLHMSMNLSLRIILCCHFDCIRIFLGYRIEKEIHCRRQGGFLNIGYSFRCLVLRFVHATFNYYRVELWLDF
jgi:hypothetical protein